MNKQKFFLVTFSFVFFQGFLLLINAQETVPNYIFLFGQIEVSSQTTISYTLTVQGTFWEIDFQNQYFPISSETEWEEASVSITGSTTENPSYTGNTAWKGFVFGWETQPYEHTDRIAKGIYIVTNSYNNSYFYIDLRDCKYQQTFVPGSYNPDFYIRFNDELDSFGWRRSPSTGSWNTISNGEVLKVWDICNNGALPTTSYFEDFWENTLVAVNDGNNHPKLVWGPYPGTIQGTIIGYRIYRCAGHIPGQPGSFSLFATVDEDVFEYTDETAIIGTDYRANSYYIKCFYDYDENIIETSATNTVEIQLQIPEKRTAEDNSLGVNINYKLDQNYPNPFNPSTRIRYSIRQNGKVSFKIFDILGNEIAVLVDELKDAGNYEIEFSAKDIPSGIYFYTLRAGNFTSTKKLILLK